MKARLASLSLLVAAAAASAQDGAKPPAPPPTKPADPPPAKATTPAAKKERKTTPEAEAAIAKFASLLHFPSPKYKTVEMTSHCDVQMMGGEVGCRFTIKDGAVALDVSLPEAVRKQYGEGQLREFKTAAASMVGGIFKPFLVPADAMAKQYDLASRVEKGKTIVELTRFADGAAWDKATLTFNADGLLEKQVGTPNVDPDDPMGAVNAGAELETTFEYKKRGDLYTIESGKIAAPMGESSVTIEYYEIAETAPLPKQLTVTTPLIPDPLLMSVHDFVLDGKKIAGTERKEDPKPAKPKPADPAKPADPPKSDK